MELSAVGPDLYACLQPDQGLGTSNSGLVDRGGGLVIDSFWDLPLTRRLAGLYASVSASPPRRLLNTHHNGDHCWGNQVFAESGAEIIAHRLCAEYFSREASPEMFVGLVESDPADLPGPLAGFAASLRRFDFRGITLTPPTTLLDGDTDLDLDGLLVRLLYVGPSHTAGDTVAWVPEHGVLYTGDVLFHRCTPIGWEGTYETWIGSLRRLEALEPHVVVPGHGPLADAAGLREMREYLEYVQREARGHWEAGRSTLEAAERIDLGRYAGWTEPERLAFNVYRAYRELEGVPWDAPVETTQVFGEVAALRDVFAHRAQD